MVEKFNGWSLEQLSERASQCTVASASGLEIRAEFLLRQTKAAQDTAQAAKDTSDYTKRYTNYMFWSVIVLAASALGTFILGLMDYFKD